MNYCIYLKKKKNKPFCKLENKEISLSRCKECDNKEYKKCTINTKKCANRNIKIYKNVNNSTKLKYKSKKLAELEKNRKSVFTNDLDHCILCGKKKEELHEIFAGRNRTNSMKYNFVLPLCHECHYQNQNNPLFSDFWHRQAQLYWEEHIGSREEFLAVFRRNYLQKKKNKSRP